MYCFLPNSRKGELKFTTHFTLLCLIKILFKKTYPPFYVFTKNFTNLPLLLQPPLKLGMGKFFKRNINDILFSSPSCGKNFLPSPHWFFTKSLHIRTETKISILSKRQLNLGCQCQSPSLRSKNFIPPLILNINFIK